MQNKMEWRHDDQPYWDSNLDLDVRISSLPVALPTELYPTLFKISIDFNVIYQDFLECFVICTLEL